jgi:hypothetical protein
MEKIFVLVKSQGYDDNYDVKVLGASSDVEILKDIIREDCQELLKEINEITSSRWDEDDIEELGEFKGYDADTFFIDEMSWFDDTTDVPTSYDIEEVKVF